MATGRVTARVSLFIALVIVAGSCAQAPIDGRSGAQVPTPTMSGTAFPSPTLTPTATPSASRSPSPGYAVFSDPYGRFSFEYPKSYWLTGGPPATEDSYATNYAVYAQDYDPAKAKRGDGWAGRTKIDVGIAPRQGVTSPEIEGASPTKIDGRDASSRVRRLGEPQFSEDRKLEGATIECAARVFLDRWGITISVVSGGDSAAAEGIFQQVLKSFQLS